jgi:hypothetical protein
MRNEFIALCGPPVEQIANGQRNNARPGARFSAHDRMATWNGARVALQRCPILHPGRSILLSFGVVGFSL